MLVGSGSPFFLTTSHGLNLDLSTSFHTSASFFVVIPLTYTEICALPSGFLHSNWQAVLHNLVCHSGNHWIHSILFLCFLFHFLCFLLQTLSQWEPQTSTTAYWFLSLCYLILSHFKAQCRYLEFPVISCQSVMWRRQLQPGRYHGQNLSQWVARKSALKESQAPKSESLALHKLKTVLFFRVLKASLAFHMYVMKNCQFQVILLHVYWERIFLTPY